MKNFSHYFLYSDISMQKSPKFSKQCKPLRYLKHFSITSVINHSVYTFLHLCSFSVSLFLSLTLLLPSLTHFLIHPYCNPYLYVSFCVLQTTMLWRQIPLLTPFSKCRSCHQSWQKVHSLTAISFSIFNDIGKYVDVGPGLPFQRSCLTKPYQTGRNLQPFHLLWKQKQNHFSKTTYLQMQILKSRYLYAGLAQKSPNIKCLPVVTLLSQKFQRKQNIYIIQICVFSIFLLPIIFFYSICQCITE